MVMDQFSFIHIFSFTVLPAGLFCILFFALKNKSEKVKRYALFAICCFNIVLYFVYKAYQAFYYDRYEFILIYNLPLHFCNLNLFLLPLAIITRNKTLMAYQVYFGTLLSFFALYAIDPAFRGEPFFEFSCMVYYYYHSMLAVIPFTFLAFKTLTPSFKAVWKPTLLLLVLTVLIHIINIVLRTTGIAADANYFFTYGLRGDPFTEFFWNIIPYEFFFLIPVLAVTFAPYIFIVTLPFHLSEKRKA